MDISLIATEGVKTIITQGILGVLVVILGWLVWVLRKENVADKAAHLADIRATGEIMQAHTVAVTEQNSLNSARSRALDAAAHAQELSVAELKRVSEELDRIRTVNEGLREEIRRWREELVRRGGA
jgi:hypothetical protein